MTVWRRRMAFVLVVDDEEPVRFLLRKLLEREGHRVAVAADGESALAAYDQSPPDLVITDLVMPRMNGLQTIRRMTESHPNIPIIAISGGSNNAGDALLSTARECGAVETLAKPFGREALLQAVANALGVA